MASYTISEINNILKAELIGNTTQKIEGPEEIRKASPTQITFIGSKKYAKFWPDSEACAALVHTDLDLEPGENRAFLKVKNVDLAMAKLLELFNPPTPVFDTDIHPTAVIHETAKIGAGCKIGANCYVGKAVELGSEVILYPNVCVFDDTTIGNNTIVWSGTIIRERCIIGSHCIFHTNVSIGADGFGYRPSEDGKGLVKIPQIGNVIIGHYVEIGANSCVDRAKFSSTIIGDGCKIDNLVQIAHNSIMGRSCIMAGHSGLAGSVTLGDGVVIGGSASIKDHTTIHSGATVGAGSGVIGDVEAGKTVLGYPAQDARDMLKQWAAIRQFLKKK
ncbi:UDP-3-O-(3-hydroxymyristoyl)glucosamine N-acyltransferase [Subsaximicrobium wynnwilliamsii]|uniref:UDP-3-O-acylglucosamine N-acyltransferase n=1 Tax=Subsaximicrobium wynnwilliamsii TaxID=291179 RepID=A0A5C6ZIY3_9FLAO|nr:UDP-3-O-(3-hydroxymyristoyl)glucosamine N-acyltransferase [Subsaximicrobium wynnwilliamsii]TXD82896.1 UDP-3-O-(3-hydroxymyristoyl)glucosamine N-acyltransferase [Subsaximicrobium wynnwilliamsii]TXD88618.1 UDP-3-O-(3-hydroxymyristoyl)glucosamine N-acyltransferase [Subsaximicrobium wynnwilliamsii]TXE02710.1 UDP-3-O-(3-hydroxymyristoyl)glucosamine N-acyltransferase [Subsaximicrobium wynnwilliamsii]